MCALRAWLERVYLELPTWVRTFIGGLANGEALAGVSQPACALQAREEGRACIS